MYRSALTAPRTARVHAHSVAVPAVRWNTALTDRNLPGGPIGGDTGSSGQTIISRAHLFELAKHLGSDKDSLRFLWHVLAWGSGSKLRLDRSRLEQALRFASPTHACVILDSRVAHTLHTRCGWASLSSKGAWPAETYQRHCSLLGRWAEEESDHLNRHVCPDEVEHWLFAPA
ncbi:hypothetical protein [Streptomyces inhibens]|uniref:8-oxoguanine DNA glycosylase OGG fold protein n=1 Tax=Streptomyces inhibens TaxID=2293571 RepID=UPI003159C337